MKDSFILYTEQKEIIDKLTDEQAGKLIKAIYQYAKDGTMPELDMLLEIAFIPIKQNLERNSEKWEDIKQKRSEAGKLGAKIKKQNQANQANANFALSKQANEAVNVNVNVNDNVNVTATAVIGSDSCADGSLQSDSCADEVANSNDVISETSQFDSCADGIVKFYEANIGLITPYEFELLNSYRADFSDDVITYALQLQVENKASGISYTKAILNNWKKSNIKTLLEAKKENKSRKTSGKKEGTSNSYHSDTSGQYSDLSKFYVN